MWMIVQRGEVTDDSSRQLQHAVRALDGLILMATRTGPVVALDDSMAPQLERHPLVQFMGPVRLNPRGAAADRLERIFAENLSRQIDLGALAQMQAAGEEPLT
jgi:hypothetical protein